MTTHKKKRNDEEGKTGSLNVTQSLAIDLFQHTRVSAITGMIGIAIMLYPHWERVPLIHALGWAAMMVAIFCARIVYAAYGQSVIQKGDSPEPLINRMAALCGLTGLGWASAMIAFDSGAMDSEFFLRLMILAAALAFVLPSMGMFYRTFLAFLLAIALSVSAFLLNTPYAQSWIALHFCIFLYVAMIIGVAVNLNRQLRAATADHLKVLGLSIELQTALQRVSHLARTDPLTGIQNRRAILESLNSEVAKCQRFGSPLAVLMIDLDHFKRINDTHGHLTGDAVLVAVVKNLSESLREMDVMGRYGGEEFLVILPMLDVKGGVLAAERLRSRVEKAQLVENGASIPVTLSIGVASYREGDDMEKMISRADNAMYVAKQAGRNRLCEEHV